MSGPRPTPTPILAMRDSWRAKMRGKEPQPQGGLGTAPRWLGKAEKAVWRQLAGELAAMGVGRRPDSNTLARYCVLWVEWKTTRNNKLCPMLLRLEQEFGLTPAARAKIEIDVPARDTATELRSKLVG